MFCVAMFHVIAPSELISFGLQRSESKSTFQNLCLLFKYARVVMTIHEVVTVLCKSGCKRGLFRDMTSNIVLEAENLVIWNWLTVKTETGRLERNKCQDNSSLLVNKENMQHWARTCKLFSFRKLEIICSSKLTIFLKLHSNYLYNLWAYFAKNGSFCCTFMFQIFLGMLAKSI